MVTTIKITCDGVFIQSNSFLTNSHHQSQPSSSSGQFIGTNSNSLNDQNGHRYNNPLMTNRTESFNFPSPLSSMENNGLEHHQQQTVSGDLRVVIRNSRRSISQCQMMENESDDRIKEETENSIYNKVEMRDKKRYQFPGPHHPHLMAEEKGSSPLERRLSHGGYRPPQNYIYLVRKVSNLAQNRENPAILNYQILKSKSTLDASRHPALEINRHLFNKSTAADNNKNVVNNGGNCDDAHSAQSVGNNSGGIGASDSSRINTSNTYIGQ